MRAGRFLQLLAVLAASMPAAAGEPLSGAEIADAVGGATTSGVNLYGNPYTVRILEDGTTRGGAGFSDEHQDTGSWWIEGDSYCRRWQTWLDGQSACFRVSIADGEVTWVDTATGATVVEAFTPAQ